MPTAYKFQSLLILSRKTEIKRNAADNLLTENVVLKAVTTMQ